MPHWNSSSKCINLLRNVGIALCLFSLTDVGHSNLLLLSLMDHIGIHPLFSCVSANSLPLCGRNIKAVLCHSFGDKTRGFSPPDSITRYTRTSYNCLCDSPFSSTALLHTSWKPPHWWEGDVSFRLPTSVYGPYLAQVTN
jgi:hypothetical protein